MLWTIGKTLALMGGLCAGWLLVQRRWLGAGAGSAEDALAGRGGCSGCTCAHETRCARDTDNPDNRERDRHAPGRL